ncbi:MAG: hypothetical protein ACRERD_30625 [Candidatus Binatia bacterium]
MKAQSLNVMLGDLNRSQEALARYQQDPETVATSYGVTTEELERLKAKDMGWLYVHGVHPYILVQFSFAIGYDFRQYLKELQEATTGDEGVSG